MKTYEIYKCIIKDMDLLQHSDGDFVGIDSTEINLWALYYINIIPTKSTNSL